MIRCLGLRGGMWRAFRRLFAFTNTYVVAWLRAARLFQINVFACLKAFLSVLACFAQSGCLTCSGMCYLRSEVSWMITSCHFVAADFAADVAGERRIYVSSTLHRCFLH
jgi:hypothetical protein